MKSITHFVFGYGSLICPKSRAVTSPEQAHKIATPVMVQGVERVWSKRTNRGMTAMGVRFVKDASCVGVILPVTNGELAAFDKREMGYDRVPLQLEDVGGVPFLSEQHYEEDDHDVFLDAKKQNNTQAIQIWVYVQRVIQPPTADHPIVQTYVDTILRGCLSISKEFAAEFISSTKGWHPTELSDDEDGVPSAEASDDSDDESVEGIWVNDRQHPVYIRGDPTWSRKNSQELDQLLMEHRPNDFSNRILFEQQAHEILELQHPM
jgi:cation transport regulator ChaC